MRRGFWQTGLRTRFAAVLLVWMAAPIALGDPAPPVTGKDAQEKQWLEGLSLLGTGQFTRASKLIHEVAAESTTDERVKRVDEWLGGFEKLQEERTKRIQDDYEKYVGWVKEETQKGEFKKAVWYCGLAFNNAIDPDAFRKEPWLVETVEGAVKTADDYEKAGKWVNAATIYVRLSEIFPLNKDYRDALDRCQAHIRLEFTYTPESDWKASVSDITPDMAIDAFGKINAEYLKDPVFKDAVVAGLKQTLRLVNEPKLKKVFTALDDAAAVKEFTSRLEANLQRAEDSDELTVKNLIEYFNRVLDINNETKLFPETLVIYEFVQGALQPLDRFSDMIWPADLPEFTKHTQGRFSGVGISIRKDPGEPIKVVSPLEDTPAYQAGVQPGDLITKINGKSARKYTINQAVREITGPPGTTVNLTLERPGENKEFDLELERKEITIFTLKGFVRDETGHWKYMIDPKQKIAYVRLTNFTEGSIDELKEVITKLKQGGMRGLIFDLRGNPGGPLKSAVEISDLFLGSNKRIVSTMDRREKEWAMSSSGDLHFTDFPLILVTNRTSASASEIVAGALQVHQRALIVGERTFGKGSVQQVLRLRNNSALLKLTTAHYYLPDGRCLHRDEDSTMWGVDPDVEVKLVPKEIIKVMSLNLKNDILKGVNQNALTADEIKALTEYKATSKPSTSEASENDEAAEEDAEKDPEEEEPTKEDVNNHPEVDPQLEAALMLMRVRLESNHPWPMRPAKMAANPAPAGG